MAPLQHHDSDALRAAAHLLGLGDSDLRPRGPAAASVRLELLDREPVRRRVAYVAVASTAADGVAASASALAVAAALRRLGQRAVATVRPSSATAVLGDAVGDAVANAPERHAVNAARELLSGVVSTPAALDVARTEIVAALALASGRDDLRARIEGAVAALGDGGDPLAVAGPMTAVLQPALEPLLIVTDGGGPAFAHGDLDVPACASVLADLVAVRCADFVLTEVGGGADLGVERFCNLKCRATGLRPRAALLVCPAGDDLRTESALERGITTFRLHDLPVVVVLERPDGDRLSRVAARAGAFDVVSTRDAADGGADPVARAVERVAREPSSFRFLYPRRAPLAAKIDAVARRALGAASVSYRSAEVEERTRRSADGLPACVVLKGARPVSSDDRFALEVEEVEWRRGAEFVLVTARVTSRIGNESSNDGAT